MTKFYKGIAGKRGYNPTGLMLHNDAGSKNANVAFYKKWLPDHDAENGFAHDYVASDGTYHAEDYANVAWHCGNSKYNKDFIGIEACQSMGDKNTFLENEKECLKLMATLCKKYNITPSRTTILLHQEVSATSCPHKSYELHGKSVNAVKDYFIAQVKAYMGNTGGSTGGGNTSSNDFNINNYHTTKFAQIELIKEDWAYKEVGLKNKKEKCKKGTILTVVGIEYSGKYPRFKLKSGLYITTRKDTVKEYKKASTSKPTTAKWVTENGTFILGQQLPLTADYSGNGKLIANIGKGQAIKYNAYLNDGKYIWIRQKRGNGYGYMATGNVKNGKRSDYWGTFK